MGDFFIVEGVECKGEGKKARDEIANLFNIKNLIGVCTCLIHAARIKTCALIS